MTIEARDEATLDRMKETFGSVLKEMIDSSG